MRASALAICLLVALAGVAKAQDVAYITIEFDNRGSKVMSKDTNAKIIKALAEKVFLVKSPAQVEKAGGIGQSSLLNHQSTVTYAAVGATTNGKSVLANCKAAIKQGWITGSTLEKSLKKATDTWMPGDSVKVKKADCSGPVAGRKMAM